MQRTWREFTECMANTYGVFAYTGSNEDNVICCPICDAPIYEKDYPFIGFEDEPPVCPICESTFG